MATGHCKACGAQTIFNAEVGSNICIACGTLEDPSQSVLTSYLDFAPHGDSTREFPLSDVNTSSLRSIRSKNGWNLAGNTKEVRENRNLVAMQKFVHSLAASLGHLGLVPRALTLFDQVRGKTPKFRWGHKAKCIAGAALAIALREANKADSLRDIAYLITEPHISVARSFVYISRTLNITITPSDPTHYLPVLQNHLLSLLQHPPDSASPSIDKTANPLPSNIIDSIAPLIPNLAGIVRTAASVCSLVYPSSVNTLSLSSSLPTTLSSLTSLPNPPAAVAALILSIEAELRRPLPQHSILADRLGNRIGAGKAAVMHRYKLISEAVLVGVENVPWLTKHEKKKTKGAGDGRSKVPKATVVVQGLKDVLSFWEDIWRKEVKSHERPVLDLEENDDDDGGCYSGDESVGSTFTNSTGSEGSARSLSSLDTATTSRKRKRGNRKLTQASQYLLSPLSSALPSGPRPPETKPAAVPHAVPGSPDLFSPAHLLTAHVASLSAPPTRLQILAMERGGEEQVRDEELFEDGELESFMRTDSEVEVAKKMMDISEDDEQSERESQEVVPKKRRKEEGGTKRIDMDRLAALLVEPLEDQDGDDPGQSYPPDGAAEEVSEWRPMSPDLGWLGGDMDVGERYDF
ncbi:hypothetical protein NEOLEDRAFT_1068191 [Neolentinus lepideus HHB14362 ss-1]|uniref:TFIIB-type domain-containing protein n=1 Tax=Neolentinus lepideus HHB14362 ss-1 TaxID=1314782 RepID=A0A165RQ70_9AGAM|nr:hypothetical protein NEOLEDRAFT_1068191 [Neolentinus lepideus HHB14362 ss-1]